VSDPIETAWAQVLAEWADPAAHRRFLVLCQSMNRLAEAGKRYRAVRDGEPERRADAQKRIDEILTLAMATLAQTKSDPAPKRRPWMLIVAIGIAGSVVMSAFWLWLRGR
jgi:hypothetical protein